MKQIRIIYMQYFDLLQQHPKMGGVESYISALIALFVDKGYAVTVYQLAQKAFSVDWLGGKVVGVEQAKSNKDLVRFIVEHENPDLENDILLFATDFSIVKSPFKHTIAIQHGVAWDIPAPSPAGFVKNMANVCLGAFRAWRKYMRYRYCKTLVCVDYNFVNWFRTQLATIPNQMKVIPNFTQLWDKPAARPQDGPVSVIFARRLVPYRGTRLFTRAILPLLEKYPNLQITVAGTGPDEKWMKGQLARFTNVHFTSFESQDSLKIHARHDIAVVPTVGSEGTSLSLLEAMSAGCAVIASNVGGLTNILINNHNGLIIAPEPEELTHALEKLITDAALRRRLAAMGRRTVEESFSLQAWQQAWVNLIQRVGEAHVR